jgi:hypothetical protein
LNKALIHDLLYIINPVYADFFLLKIAYHLVEYQQSIKNYPALNMPSDAAAAIARVLASAMYALLLVLILHSLRQLLHEHHFSC